MGTTIVWPLQEESTAYLRAPSRMARTLFIRDLFPDVQHSPREQAPVPSAAHGPRPTSHCPGHAFYHFIVIIVIGAYEPRGILSNFTGGRKIFAFCVNLVI